MGLALAIAIGDGQLSIRAPDRKIRAVEIVLLSFSPFSTAWKIIFFKDDRQKRQAFSTFEAKVMRETLGGGRSNRDGGDGSHRGSVRTCFMWH